MNEHTHHHDESIDMGQWISAEIPNRPGTYHIEIAIPTKGRTAQIRGLITSDHSQPGEVSITIPLTSGPIHTERSIAYDQLFNEAAGFNQRSLDLAEAGGIESQAMEVLGITADSLRPFTLISSWGMHPKGSQINSVGFTSSLHVNGSALTLKELFGAVIRYDPLTRSRRFSEKILQKHAWNITPIPS